MKMNHNYFVSLPYDQLNTRELVDLYYKHKIHSNDVMAFDALDEIEKRAHRVESMDIEFLKDEIEHLKDEIEHLKETIEDARCSLDGV